MTDLGLPEVCDVLRATLTPDGRGGYTQAWSTIATVPARLSPDPGITHGFEGERADEVALAKRWLITVPVGTDVTSSDRLSIDSRTFNVVDHDAGRTFDISIRIRAEEVT